MLHEFVSTTDILQAGEADLGNDSTKLSGCGGNTVSGRTITSGENLARDDEGGGIRSKVLEEVGQAVQKDERLLCRICGCKLVVAEA